MTRPNIGMDYAVLDCPDPAALANFYVQVLEWKSVRDEDDWHVIEGPGGAARISARSGFCSGGLADLRCRDPSGSVRGFS